ncbi:MAG TPA: lipopolysaccharide transport periplasmic protein LptA [Quisquiliibacterium sp.]|nr:lipopolysaccharide transport periplasmic protein LptA [Quisquiliibacterium sp.]
MPPRPAFPPLAVRRSARHALAAAALLLGVLASGPAFAERADRDKPVNIEADSMQYDDAKQVNVFNGNVTLTKGTILIRADRLVLRQDPEGNQHGTAYGNPASFRQKRDGVDEFIVGTGQQLVYDGKSEIVRLEQRATLKRLQSERVTDEVHGNLIVYDSRSEFFDVRSGGPASATPENPGGRVRVVIQPKSPPAAEATPAPLTPAQGIDPARK